MARDRAALPRASRARRHGFGVIDLRCVDQHAAADNLPVRPKDVRLARRYQHQFIALALRAPRAAPSASSRSSSGRVSPYFFNAGLFNDGASLAALGRCYAAALLHSQLQFDMLFGPAYKGIPLVAATAIALAEQHRRNVPWAFNRKEAKDHGEAGRLVGRPARRPRRDHR